MGLYSSVSSHRSMVFDRVRNALYTKGIRNYVTSESVVLDLGAGLGIMGFVAAASGARKVYMVDPSPVLRITDEIIKKNGLCDTIQCLNGRIEEIDLPEKVDLIISVCTGNFLLAEDLLPSLLNARDRFLKPGGKLLPDRAVMQVAPVRSADFYKRNIACWSNKISGIEFTPARTYSANEIYPTRGGDSNHTLLSSPASVFELDLAEAKNTSCRGECTFEIRKDDVCHGLLGWFRARLGDDWLTTGPEDKETHWSQNFLPLDPPLNLRRGETLAVQIVRPEFGDWTWTVQSGNQTQRKSTFLSGGLSLDMLKKGTETYRPVLTPKGEIAHFVLQNMAKNRTLGEIQQEVVARFGIETRNAGEIRRMVRALVEKYS